MTALHRSANNGYLTTLKHFVETVGYQKVKNKWGYTPFILAAQAGHLPIVLYLKDRHDADPLIKHCLNNDIARVVL